MLCGLENRVRFEVANPGVAPGPPGREGTCTGAGNGQVPEQALADFKGTAL